MKRKHTLRSLLSMVCTIAMIISMVPVLPAAAAEDDLLFDNMESYTVGTDLYTQAPDKYTQKSPSWNAVKDAGGSATVVADPLNSKNKVIAVTTVGGDSKRYVLATAPELNSDYTLQFDYMPGDAEGNPNSGFMDVYINSGNAHNARIASGPYNTYFNLDKANCSNTIKNAELDMKNIWYSVRIVVTAGQYVMDIWEKGNEDTKLTCTTTKGTKAVSKAHVEFCIGPYLASQGVANTADPITNYIDNIRITPGVAEAEDPSAAGSGTGDVSVAGGGMIEFVDEYIIENKDAVAVTAGMGIFSGKDGNRFDPQGQLTRAEMATVIVKMLRGNAFNADNFKGVKTFSDTADYQGGWAEGYINACVQLGIVSGYGDGTFKPGNPVNTAEALTMIINALKVDAGQGEWPATIMAKAQDMKLYGDLDVKPGTYDALTRDQLAVLVYEGMCYSPSDITGWIVDGVNSDIVFTSYGEAMKAARDDLSKIHEVMGEDTLASKIYDMKIVEGFIVSNQETSADKYTTIITLDDEGESATLLNMTTSLDKVGHYVTAYYRETWNGDKDPGVVYNYVDKTEVITVEKDITTSKDYKEVFYEKYDAADDVAQFDGSYNYDVYDSIDDIYTAGSKAAAGTYFVYEGEIVGYMKPAPVYAAKVVSVNDTDGSETIDLSVVGPISNSADNDCVREYKGIAKDDYVIYTKVGSGDDAIYVLTQVIEVKGAVSKKTTNKDGDSVVTVNGVQYVQFAGSNENEYNNITKFNDDEERTTAFNGNLGGTYVLYITMDGKYIGFEEAAGSMSLDDTVFILGTISKEYEDSYGTLCRETLARGVDLNGNEVLLLVKLEKGGRYDANGRFWADEAFEDLDSAPLPADETEGTFYTYELSKDSDAKKNGIYKLTAYPTAYDPEDPDALYAGGQTIEDAAYSFTYFDLGGTLTYSQSNTKYMMLEGDVDQDTPLTGTVKTSWSTSSNHTGAAMRHYYLLSRNESGAQMLDVAVIYVEQNAAAATGAGVVYVSPANRVPTGRTADGYVYDVYDYKTAAKKEITLKIDDPNLITIEDEQGDEIHGVIEQDGYWFAIPDEMDEIYTVLTGRVSSTTFTGSTSASTSEYAKDQLYSENIAHEQQFVAMANDLLTTTSGTRLKSPASAIVLDVRTEEEIENAGLGKVNSLARIMALSVDMPEVTVIFDLCYAANSKVLTIFVKDVYFTSTEETTITEKNDVYYIDGRPVADDVDINDNSGVLGTDDPLGDIIDQIEAGKNVDLTYEMAGGKVVAITVNSVLSEGELFSIGFDSYEDGEDYTGTVIEGTDAGKYTSVTTETIGDVKALEVTAKGTSSDTMYPNMSFTGSYVWETRMKMANTTGYTKLYTSALGTKGAQNGTTQVSAFASLQIHVSGSKVEMYRNGSTQGLREDIVSTDNFKAYVNDWITIRVTVTNPSGTDDDAILIEVFAEDDTKLGELYQSGDEVSVATSSRIGFDVRGNDADTSHTIDIDYVKVTRPVVADEATVKCTGDSHGRVDYVGTAAAGEEITIVTTAESGYKLNKLLVNGVDILDNNDRLDDVLETEYTVTDDDVDNGIKIEAKFVAIGKGKVTFASTDDVALTVTDAEGNPVVSGTEFVEGTVLNVAAEVTNTDDYALDGIYVGDTKLDGTYTVTDEDVTIEAKLRAYKFYTLTAGDCLNGGLFLTHNGITSGDKVREGTEVTITAIPNDGFEVHEIYVNGTKITGTTFELTAETTVTAVFWPEGAVIYDNFEDYTAGANLPYGGTDDTWGYRSRYNAQSGSATATIVSEAGRGKVLALNTQKGTGTSQIAFATADTVSGNFTVKVDVKAEQEANDSYYAAYIALKTGTGTGGTVANLVMRPNVSLFGFTNNSPANVTDYVRVNGSATESLASAVGVWYTVELVVTSSSVTANIYNESGVLLGSHTKTVSITAPLYVHLDHYGYGNSAKTRNSTTYFDNFSVVVDD